MKEADKWTEQLRIAHQRAAKIAEEHGHNYIDTGHICMAMGCCECEAMNDKFATTFQPGDVVQLKSGGPKMVVTHGCASDGRIGCHWFDVSGKNLEGMFWPITLKIP
jgi:uncharacterized protein YodC (DUF2158 family)